MIGFECKLCKFYDVYDNAPHFCPECNSKSYTLIFKNDDVERGKKKQVTENERWSISMGCPPSQVEEFRKRYPNSVYRDDGRLLVKNYKHKLKQGKERGMVELKYMSNDKNEHWR